MTRFANLLSAVTARTSTVDVEQTAAPKTDTDTPLPPLQIIPQPDGSILVLSPIRSATWV